MSAPTVHLELDRPVPGSVVRLTPAVAAVLCAFASGVGPGGWVLAGLAVAVLVARPAWPAAPGLAVLVGAWVFAGGDLLAPPRASEDGWWRAALLVLAVHVLVRSAALARHVAWSGLVERRLLARVGRSVLGVQVVAQVLVLTVMWVRTGVGPSATGQGWVRLVAVAGVVAVGVLLVPRAWLLGSGGRSD